MIHDRIGKSRNSNALSKGDLGRLADAAVLLQQFAQSNLGRELARIERQLQNRDANTLVPLLSELGLNADVVAAALLIKRVAGQINVTLHALGVLMALPTILEPGEHIQSASLGAGNTGRAFDLETNLRIAEFKFIQWRGGAEAIRQNSLFKDFYMLAEAQIDKRKYLYIVDLTFPLKFLTGRRALKSVMSKDTKLYSEFKRQYDDRFLRVYEYFEYRRNDVTLVDLCSVVPSLCSLTKNLDGLDELP